MNKERASLWEKISFGSGSMIYCLEMILVLTYLMPFCSDVLQIDVAVVGVIMTAVKLLDAVSDLLITNLADRTETKWGKYRVWILNGIPLSIVLVLLFWSPSFLTTSVSKMLWVCVLYLILVPVFETAVASPYMAMIITMSEDAKDRLDFSNARALGEAAAQIIVSAAVMPIILSFGSHRNVTGWRVASVVIAAIILLCTFLCFKGTKERIHVSYQDDDGRQMPLRQKLRPLHGNRPFWKLIGIIVFFMAHFYLSSALFFYFCSYNLGHTEWVSPLLTLGFCFQIILTVLLFYLGRKFEKRTLLIVGGLCILGADAILLFANDFYMAAGYQILLGIGNGMFNGIAFAMLPDVTDYTEWKTGTALPGMISAVATFAMKLGGAVATFAASQVLVWAKYDETLEVQSASTCQWIRICFPVLSAVCLLAAFILAIRMREVSKKAVIQYRVEIDARMCPEHP